MSADSRAPRYILKNGRLYRAPFSPLGLLSTRLIGFGSKYRILSEPFRRLQFTDAEESLADFVRRKFGLRFSTISWILSSAASSPAARKSWAWRAHFLSYFDGNKIMEVCCAAPFVPERRAVSPDLLQARPASEPMFIVRIGTLQVLCRRWALSGGDSELRPSRGRVRARPLAKEGLLPSRNRR